MDLHCASVSSTGCFSTCDCTQVTSGGMRRVPPLDRGSSTYFLESDIDVVSEIKKSKMRFSWAPGRGGGDPAAKSKKPPPVAAAVPLV